MRLSELEHWLTPVEAARELGVTRQTVNKKLRDGRYRAVKTHLGYLIDPASIEAERKVKAKV